MNTGKILRFIALVYGIIVTLLLSLIFVPKLMGAFHSTKEFIDGVTQWYDNPTGFVFTYFIGYLILWWKPLSGAIIIMLGSALFFAFNPHNYKFMQVFLIPTFMVGVIYFIYWLKVLRTEE